MVGVFLWARYPCSQEGYELSASYKSSTAPHEAYDLTKYAYELTKDATASAEDGYELSASKKSSTAPASISQ